MVVFALSAAPHAFANESGRHANASWRNAHAEAITAGSDSRAAALRECNNHVAKLKDYTWGVQEIFEYRGCMAEHGQAE
jgi:hypothetical protein